MLNIVYGIYSAVHHNLLRIVLLVSHNSFGADTIHFVFLEISGSLDWSAMSQIPPLANY